MVNKNKLKQKLKIYFLINKHIIISCLGFLLALSGCWLFFGSYFPDDSSVAIMDGINVTDKNRIAMEKQINEMVKGYPLEPMVPYIVEKDPKVAAFLVSIAKKESNWGVHAPVLNGQDCYNYWGFRQQRARMGSGGHTCFDNPQDAVDSVAARIEDLVEKDIDTPGEMIIWKCGSSCRTHSSGSVAKWISDVGMFFKKLYR